MARIKTVTLVADQVATVELDRDARLIEVLNVDGAAPVWFTVDGGAPTVDGDDVEVLPAAISAAEVLSPDEGATTVRLLSSGTPKVSIRVLKV